MSPAASGVQRTEKERDDDAGTQKRVAWGLPISIVGIEKGGSYEQKSRKT
jgi:hypothetical protein